MNRGRLTGPTLMAFILLAGCAGAQQPVANDVPPSTPVSVAPDRGEVRGFVGDESLSPLADALITLDALREARSGPDGSFAFSEVEPGPHEIGASLAGYEAQAQRGEVVAGTVAEVRFILVAAPSLAAYHETVIQDGLIFCGIAWNVTGGLPLTKDGTGCTGLMRGLPGDVSAIDRSHIAYPLGNLESLSGLVGETTWDPSQPAAATLVASWGYDVDAQRLGYFTVAAREGPSPIQVMITQQQLLEGLTESASEVCTKADCTMASSKIGGAGFGADGARAGLLLEQRFQDFLTVFRNGLMPEEFSALPPAG